MVQLANGVRDVGRGFAALREHPRLWKYVLAPALISLLVYAALIAGAVAIAHPLIARITDHLPSFLSGLAGGLITIVLGVVLAVVALFLFVSIAGIIAGPFCEALSEHLEEAMTGRPAAPFSLATFLHGLGLAIAHGLRRLLASLWGFALVFLIGWIPVVGTIAAIALGGYLTANAAAYDCYDAVLGRRNLAYRAKLAYLSQHRGRTLGLGAGIAAMMLVPVVNLVALGLGSAGATVAWLELEGASKRR